MLMKKILVIIFVFLEGLTVAQTKNVLFIGNSYTYTNNMPQIVADLASSVGDNMTFEMSAPAGYKLIWHASNSTTLGLIHQGGWDYVVLQEYSQNPSEPIAFVESDVYPPAAALDTEINTYNPDAETIFYMTWGRRDGDEDRCPVNPPVCTYEGMDDLTRERYMYMAQANHAIVSPVGAVWRYLRENNPAIELYQPDGSHPSPEGSYAAAVTFYTTIFRKDPALLTYNFSLSASNAAIIRNAVRTVVYNNLMTWHIGEYDPDTQKPSVPSGLVASDITNTTFTLSWRHATDNFGVIEYQVFRDGTLFVTETDTSALITDLSPGTAYSMTVRAKDAAGNLSDPSVALNVTTTGTVSIVLTISGVTANSRPYNGTEAATINTSGAALTGVVAGDNVSLVTSGATASFASKSAGTGKTVTTIGFTLTGTDAGKYILVQPVLTANITPIGLTITGVSVYSKTYNGNTAANLNTTSAALSGLITGDYVTLSTGDASGTFNNKNVGTGKPVTISGFVLAGADAGNYSLAQPSATGTVTRAPLTVAGVTAANKVYDGTNTAALNISAAALSGAVTGDALTLSSSGVTGVFENALPGLDKTVFISGFSVSGTDAPNYTLNQPTATADITGITLTISGVAANNRVYNGTTNATLNAAGATLNGVISGDVVSLVSTSATGTFDNKNVGSGKTVTTSGFSLSGADAAKYLVTQPVTTGAITTASLTVNGLQAYSKEYDGNTTATLNIESGVLTGVFGSDEVNLVTAGVTGTFNNKNAGTGKTVTTTGFSVNGTDAHNYTLVQPVATGTIRQAPLTVNGVTASNKVYDGTVDATIQSNLATLSGVLGGETVNLVTTGASGVFEDKNVGNGKTVVATGYTLTGPDAVNYFTEDPGTTANITRAGLTITGVTVNTRTYNGTRTASLNASAATLSGLFSGDEVYIVASGASGLFADKNVGTGKPVTTTGFALTGDDAGNYSLTQPSVTGTITQAALSITGVAAANKIYDGTTAATLNTSSAALTGVFSPDAITLLKDNATGTFVSRNVGTAITVNTSGFGISGAEAGNYTVVQPSSSASITKKALLITADDQDKNYRAVFTFTGNEFTASGLVQGDTPPVVTLTSPGAAADAEVGTYSITAAGGQLPNYTVTYAGGTMTIHKAQLTAAADDKSISYGTSLPKLTITYSGFLSGDNISDIDALPVASTTASELGDAGSYPITVSGGNDDNYDIIPAAGVLEIRKAELTVTPADAERQYAAPDPVFTLYFTGFVAGQTQSEIDALPVATSGAQSDSDVGTYEISVSGGSDNNYSFIYRTGELEIVKADQVIAYDDFPEKMRITQDYQLVATATSRLPVIYEITDNGVATLNGDLLTIHSEGPLTITARQEGDNNWNPAPDLVMNTETLPTFDNITSLFTPNGDGMNDYWYIPDIDSYGKVQVTVYNRYGQVVYKSDNYKNDWEGTYNGSPLPSAAYYYIMKSSEKGYVKGVVNIVR